MNLETILGTNKKSKNKNNDINNLNNNKICTDQKVV
jgi:hypothetical protein